MQQCSVAYNKYVDTKYLNLKKSKIRIDCVKASIKYINPMKLVYYYKSIDTLFIKIDSVD